MPLPPDHCLRRRSMNKTDPNGVNEWDTVRDMEKVWETLPGYGPDNTLLLDNEARKFHETPRNGIVVPEYGPAKVKTRKKDTMTRLLKYLLKMQAESPWDVREYIEVDTIGSPMQSTSEWHFTFSLLNHHVRIRVNEP